MLIFWTTAGLLLAFAGPSILIFGVASLLLCTVNELITIMTFKAPFDAEEVLEMPLAYEEDDLEGDFEDDDFDYEDDDFEDDDLDYEDDDFEEDLDLEDEDIDDEDIDLDDDLDFDDEDEI